MMWIQALKLFIQLNQVYMQPRTSYTKPNRALSVVLLASGKNKFSMGHSFVEQPKWAASLQRYPPSGRLALIDIELTALVLNFFLTLALMFSTSFQHSWSRGQLRIRLWCSFFEPFHMRHSLTCTQALQALALILCFSSFFPRKRATVVLLVIIWEKYSVWKIWISFLHLCLMLGSCKTDLEICMSIPSCLTKLYV